MENKKFLVNSEETGRQIVISLRTKRKYYIESISDSKRPADWGDLNPVTKKVEGSYGSKYTGAITESESLITTENGFSNIETIKGGSPYSIIEQMDAKYPDAI